VTYLRQSRFASGWRWQGIVALLSLLRQRRKDLYAGVRVHAANDPAHPALVTAHETFTYKELDFFADQFTRALDDAAIHAGDKIVVALGNTTAGVIATIGAGNLGSVVVPISPYASSEELVYVVRHADARVICLNHEQWLCLNDETRDFLGSRLVIVHGEETPKQAVSWDHFITHHSHHRKTKPSRHGADLMLYTSGTTGQPKGALLDTHHISYLRAYEVMSRLGITRYDRFHTACPFYHAAPQALIGFVLTLGGTVYLDEKFDAENTHALWERADITSTFVVPTQIVRLLEKENGLATPPKTLTRLICGGAPLAASLKKKTLETFGPILYDFYGATELGMVSLATPELLQKKPATVGSPFPGVDVKLITEDGSEAIANELGEIFVSSDQFNFQYYKDPPATQKALRGNYRTVGDIGYKDRDGDLFIVDRKTDMMISGGENIYPAEIEHTLLQHPHIADVAVVGEPDNEWGERVCAFIVPREGKTLTACEVIEFCANHLSSMKKPRRVVFVKEIPRNTQGKILKRQLREELKPNQPAPAIQP